MFKGRLIGLRGGCLVSLVSFVVIFSHGQGKFNGVDTGLYGILGQRGLLRTVKVVVYGETGGEVDVSKDKLPKFITVHTSVRHNT